MRQRILTNLYGIQQEIERRDGEQHRKNNNCIWNLFGMKIVKRKRKKRKKRNTKQLNVSADV